MRGFFTFAVVIGALTGVSWLWSEEPTVDKIPALDVFRTVRVTKVGQPVRFNILNNSLKPRAFGFQLRIDGNLREQWNSAREFGDASVVFNKPGLHSVGVEVDGCRDGGRPVQS